MPFVAGAPFFLNSFNRGLLSGLLYIGVALWRAVCKCLPRISQLKMRLEKWWRLAVHWTLSCRWSLPSIRVHRELRAAVWTLNTCQWWELYRLFTLWKSIQCAYCAQCLAPPCAPPMHAGIWWELHANIYIYTFLTCVSKSVHYENGDICKLALWNGGWWGLFSVCVCVCVTELCWCPLLLQSHSDGESQRSNMEREDTRSSPSTPSTPSVCSPTSTTSSVPSTGKNMCASCGQEILDRYLLKVRGRAYTAIKTGRNWREHNVSSCLFGYYYYLLLFLYIYFYTGINIDRQQIACLHKTRGGERRRVPCWPGSCCGLDWSAGLSRRPGLNFRRHYCYIYHQADIKLQKWRW